MARSYRRSTYFNLKAATELTGMSNLFNNPNGHRGSAIVMLPMHKLYSIFRDRIEYNCLGEQSIDPDAITQNACVEIEKAMGIFPNLEPGIQNLGRPRSIGKISVETVFKRIDDLRKVTETAKSPGNGDYNDYMRGMANGLILALATMEDETPEYLLPETVKPTRSEETSPEVASAAARLVKITHRKLQDALARPGEIERLIADIRTVAGSALTQKPARGPRD